MQITLAAIAAIVVCTAIMVVHRQSQTIASASQPTGPGFPVVRSSFALKKIEKHSSTNRSLQSLPLEKPEVATNTEATDPGQEALKNSVSAPEDPAKARAAMGLVGIDPEAETYWTEVINDPNVPATERRVLIQGLSQAGLSNPRNPTPDDMAIIANRMALIEEIAPDAVDQSNADAFADVYNNLASLYDAQPAN